MCQVLASFEDCRLDCIRKVEYLSNFVLFKTWSWSFIFPRKNGKLLYLLIRLINQNRKTSIVLVYASQNLTLMEI